MPNPPILISCVIPARDKNDPLLKELIRSIKAQNFPPDRVEIIVVTEGDSESAKAIGIRKAKGFICAMFCADNYLVDKDLFRRAYYYIKGGASAAYPYRYHYIKKDNSLNRYFSLIGGNDCVPYYLGKNDREPHVKSLRRTSSYEPSYGCNGFFYKADLIKATDLDNYYPMDNALEVPGKFVKIKSDGVWHRTSDTLLTFLIKRYKYARNLYCDRNNRRWKMVDGPKDYLRLTLFVLASITLIEPISVSIRGYVKIKDKAWFWHPVACLGFTITYGILTVRTCLKHLLSFRP